MRNGVLLKPRDSRVLVHFGSPEGTVYGSEVVFQPEVEQVGKVVSSNVASEVGTV